MKQPVSIRSSSALTVFCVLALATLLLAGVALYNNSAEHQAAYRYWSTNSVSSIETLAEDFDWERTQLLPLCPPDPDFKMTMPGNWFGFDPAVFPAAFTQGLIAGDANGALVYVVTMAEDPSTRYRVVLNSEGKIIGAVPPPADYSPKALLLSVFPHLYDGCGTQEEENEVTWRNDPARMRIQYTLVPLSVSESQLAAFRAFGQSVSSDPPLPPLPPPPGTPPPPGKPIDYSAMIAGGYAHSIYCRLDGTIWAWGDNKCGQLGIAPANCRPGLCPGVLLANQVPSISEVAAVSAGLDFSLMLKRDGTVWESGGVCGKGKTSGIPVQVGGLTGIVAISSASFHSLALDSGSNVWQWSAPACAEAASAGRSEGIGPRKAHGLSDVRTVAAGDTGNLAVKSDGTVWTWGGCGKVKQVAGLSDVKRVACGQVHNLALKNDGTVWAWGNNSDGQLGDGTRASKSYAVQARGLTNVTAIACGERHSVALRGDGTVWACGDNRDGQLGDGTGTARFSPVQMAPGIVTHAIGVAAGDRHTLVLMSSGITVWTCGANASGQLGTGTTTAQSEPTLIDSDGDGLPDPWEYEHLGNLNFDGGRTLTNVKFTGVRRANQGVELVLGYPAAFTNRLDIYRCTDLVKADWILALTTNADLSIHRTTWIDPQFETMERAFYVAGNVDFDGDGDGLPSAREKYLYKTDMANPDTDGDGLLDGEEVLTCHTDPRNPDTDHDGLTDGQEVNLYHTNPLQADTDNDGLSDGAEVLTYHTSPLLADTDGDTMPDGYEVAYLGGTVFCDPATNANRLGLWTTNTGTWSAMYYWGPETQWSYHLMSTASTDATLRKDFGAVCENYTLEARCLIYPVSGAYHNPDSTAIRFGSGYDLLVTAGGVTPFDPTVQLTTQLRQNGSMIVGTLRTFDAKFWTTPGLGGTSYRVSVSLLDGALSYTVEYTKPDGTAGQVGISPVQAAASTDYLELWQSGIDTAATRKGFGAVTVTKPGLDPLNAADAAGDLDKDGVTNKLEAASGTNPLKSDTDGDGFPDGWELQYFGAAAATNAALPGKANDADGDGLSNWDEFLKGTNPIKWDTDGDLLPDGWEVARGLSPTSAVGVDGASGDPDGDGLSNLDELIFGSHPKRGDTDSDGMNDKSEVDVGRWPAYTPDPTGTPVRVILGVGDPTAPYDERYTLDISTDDDPSRLILSHQGPSYGEYSERTYNQFRSNTWYRAKVRDVGTRLGAATRLDYRARIGPEDTLRYQLEKGIGFDDLIGTFSDCAPEKFAATVKFRIVPRKPAVDLDGREPVGGGGMRDVPDEEEMEPGVKLASGVTQVVIPKPWPDDGVPGCGEFTLAWTNPPGKTLQLNGENSPITIPGANTTWPTNFTATVSGAWTNLLDSVVVTLSHSENPETDQVRLGRVLKLEVIAVQIGEDGRPVVLDGVAQAGEVIDLENEELCTYAPSPGTNRGELAREAPPLGDTSKWVTLEVSNEWARLTMTHGTLELFESWELAKIPGSEGFDRFELLGDPGRTVVADVYWVQAPADVTDLKIRLRDEAFTGSGEEFNLEYRVYVPEAGASFYSNCRMTGLGDDIGYPALSSRNLVMLRVDAGGDELDFGGRFTARVRDDTATYDLTMTRRTDGKYYSEAILPILHIDAGEDTGLEETLPGVVVLKFDTDAPVFVDKFFAIDDEVLGSIAKLDGKVDNAMLISALMSDEYLSRGSAVRYPAAEAVNNLGLGVTPLFQPQKPDIVKQLKSHRMWVHSGHGSFAKGITMLRKEKGRYKVDDLTATDLAGIGVTYRLVLMNTCQSTDQYSVYCNGVWQPANPTNVAVHKVFDLGTALNAKNYVGWDCSVVRALSIHVPKLLMQAFNAEGGQLSKRRTVEEAVKKVRDQVSNAPPESYPAPWCIQRLRCVRSDGTFFDAKMR